MHLLEASFTKKFKSFPSLTGSQGSGDLRFIGPQPDTSRSCRTTDMGLVHRTVCPFILRLMLVLI